MFLMAEYGEVHRSCGKRATLYWFSENSPTMCDLVLVRQWVTERETDAGWYDRYPVLPHIAVPKPHAHSRRHSETSS